MSLNITRITLGAVALLAEQVCDYYKNGEKKRFFVNEYLETGKRKQKINVNRAFYETGKVYFVHSNKGKNGIDFVK